MTKYYDALVGFYSLWIKSAFTIPAVPYHELSDEDIKNELRSIIEILRRRRKPNTKLPLLFSVPK